jgi:hypothetical protein
MIQRKKYLSSLFPKIITGILLIFLVVVGLTWIKQHEKFGFQRFVDFTLPTCREPLFVMSQKLSLKQLPLDWEIYKDEVLGYQINKPIDWTVDRSCGAQACINSADLKFYDSGKPTGGRIQVRKVSASHNFSRESFSYSNPTTVLEYVGEMFKCSFVDINGLHGIRQISYGAEKHQVYFVESGNNIYIIEPQMYSQSTVLQQSLDSVLSSFSTIAIVPGPIGDTGAYNGIPSPQVPYENIVFNDINVHIARQTNGELKSDIPFNGFTFAAFEGETIVFTSLLPGSMNHADFVEMELYSYGPTVIKRQSYLEFTVPVTGRYFLVVKGKSGANNLGKYYLRIDIHN